MMDNRDLTINSESDDDKFYDAVAIEENEQQVTREELMLQKFEEIRMQKQTYNQQTQQYEDDYARMTKTLVLTNPKIEEELNEIDRRYSLYSKKADEIIMNTHNTAKEEIITPGQDKNIIFCSERTSFKAPSMHVEEEQKQYNTCPGSHVIKDNYMSINTPKKNYNAMVTGTSSLDPTQIKQQKELTNYPTFQTKVFSSAIKNKLSKKNKKDFEVLLFAQELNGGESTIWTAKFSPDGLYLATGGKDSIIRLWTVNKALEDEIGDPGKVFEVKPRELKAHRGDILSLEWSPFNYSYLLSASLDNTVILWDVLLQNEPYKIFPHPDVPTCLSWNPLAEKQFVAGSFDKFLRVWNTDTEKVVEYQQTRERITSIAYTPDGSRLIVGLFQGSLVIYICEKKKLNYYTTLDCRNRRGKFSNGKKVTGITFFNAKDMLITSCDNRIRMIDLTDLQMKFKYKGHSNEQIPLCANISEDGEYIVSGSEDGNVYIWNKTSHYIPPINPRFTGFKADRNSSIEYFKPFETTRKDKKLDISCALIAPFMVLKNTLCRFAEYSMTINTLIVACGTNGYIRVFLNKV